MVCEGLILTHIMTQIFQKRCKKFDGNALIFGSTDEQFAKRKGPADL
jgi:hypothetical protein